MNTTNTTTKSDLEQDIRGFFTDLENETITDTPPVFDFSDIFAAYESGIALDRSTGGSLEVTAEHSDDLGWHCVARVTDGSGKVIDSMVGEDEPGIDGLDREFFINKYVEKELRAIARNTGDIHSETLTSPDGYQTVEVTWREQVVYDPDTGDFARDRAFQGCPAEWDDQEFRATNEWRVTTAPPEQYNIGGGQVIVEADRASSDTPDEDLAPGSYKLRWCESRDDFVNRVVKPAFQAVVDQRYDDDEDLTCKWSYSTTESDPELYAPYDVTVIITMERDEDSLEWNAEVDGSSPISNVDELTDELLDRADELIEKAVTEDEDDESMTTTPDEATLLARAARATEAVRQAQADLDAARVTEREAARAAYAAGATAYRVAQVTGRSQTAIAKWVHSTEDGDDPQLAKRRQSE